MENRSCFQVQKSQLFFIMVHFCVADTILEKKDSYFISKLISNFTSDNVLFIVSGPETRQEGINVDIDCELAAENTLC